MSDQPVVRPSNESNNLVRRMRDLWKRIEPGTDDVVLMTQVSAVMADAALRLERLEGEHENITRGRLPTHRCTVCDTFWMDLPEHKAMTMVGIMCGDTCCVGSNIEKLPTIRSSSETPERPLTAEQFYDAYIIHFDDADVPIEVFSGYGAGDGARKAFEQHLSQWNCQLFRMVDDGKRPSVKARVCPDPNCVDGYVPSQPDGEPVACPRCHPSSEPR